MKEATLLSIPYPVDELVEGMILDEGVYGGTDSRVPLVPKNAVLTRYQIDKLLKNDVHTVKVKQAPTGSGLIEIPKESPVISARLRNETVTYLSDLFAVAQGKFEDAALASKTIRQLDNVVNQLVASLSQEGRSLIDINDLKSYDEYTYHHSLSVSVVSIAIAQYLGFSNRGLTQIGKCALMHDIGKTKIPLEIINKKSKLDDDEFEVIKNHPPEGYRYLSERSIGDEEIWEGVLYHHEKIDGTGYPMGLMGEDIPIMSRIISVADVYDALTSVRPYRNPMQPADAMEYIMGGATSAFDFDVVAAFMQKIQPYPVGSMVELSDGRICTVLDNDFTLRPVVQALDNGELLDLANERACLELVIVNMFMETANSV